MQVLVSICTTQEVCVCVCVCVYVCVCVCVCVRPLVYMVGFIYMYIDTAFGFYGFF